MKYYVNEDCIACGLCEATCPEVFTLVDGRSKAIGSDVPEEHAAGAALAMEQCPVNAIQIAE